MKTKGVYLASILLCMNLILGCSTIKQNVEPTITEEEAYSFSTVVPAVLRLDKQYGAKNVLIVLDIDNTILTSSVDLGGDIWYQWQTGKLNIKPEASQKVSCLYEDAIGLLYELVPMKLTEDNLPEVISNWQKSGNTVMALTSRAPKYRAVTERELGNRKINLELNALALTKQEPLVYTEFKGREISYMKGILMTSGLDKGEMLKYILDKTNRKLDAIVFVDDTEKNIKAVHAGYEHNSNVDMKLFHYTHVEKRRIKKFGAILTQEQAIKMDADWKKLNETLNSIFPARNISLGCLSMN